MHPVSAHPCYGSLRWYQQRLAELLATSVGEQPLPGLPGFGLKPTLIVAAETKLGDVTGGNLAVGKEARVLVLANRPVVAHWLDEWQQYGWLPAVVVSNGPVPTDESSIVITNYTNFSKHSEEYLAVPWRLAVVDEPLKPLSAPTPTGRQRALRDLRAETPLWLTGRYASGTGMIPTDATHFLLEMVFEPSAAPFQSPGPLSRPSALAERLGWPWGSPPPTTLATAS